MTVSIALRDAAVTFGGAPLFSGLDLALEPGERACLVGRNGSGKSTLMRVLAGLQDLDRGERFVQPGLVLAHLSQAPDLAGHATVASFVAAGLPAHRSGEIWRVDAVLEPLGLSSGRGTDGLSGGESRRAAHARALVGEPDILLLDEPTNHLDLPTIEWLEATLRGFRGALLTISHDRRFLSAVTNRTFWLDRGRLFRLDAGFDGFEAWSEGILAQEDAETQRMDKKLEAEARWLHRGVTARRRRNQGRLRALHALRAERRERRGPEGVAAITIAEGGRGAARVIEAEHLRKAYGDRVVIADASLRIMRGDRLGVIGPNGAGKSTLVKMLTGELAPDTGRVTIGEGVETLWFDQMRSTLDPEQTVKSVLLPHGGDFLDVGGTPKHVAGYLADFLFDPSRLFSPVKALSGGERSRLLLARLFARPSNLIVMDEPTNDLDMETLDLLQEVLADYPGTLILVSHDRDFLDRLVTSIVAVEGDGSVAEYVGGWDDYLRQRPEPPAARRPDRPQRVAEAVRAPRPAAPARGKLSFKDQRELDRLPETIAALEAEIARLVETLADPGLFARDPKGFDRATRRLAEAESEKAAAEDRWLELEMRREALLAG